MEIGNTINTSFGKGKITAHEEIYKKSRWGVELENNPFSYSPVYFWETEIEADPPHSAGNTLKTNYQIKDLTTGNIVASGTRQDSQTPISRKSTSSWNTGSITVGTH